MSDLLILALGLVWLGGFLMGYGLRGLLNSKEIV